MRLHKFMHHYILVMINMVKCRHWFDISWKNSHSDNWLLQISVTIQNRTDAKFKGFMIQARKRGDQTASYGTFLKVLNFENNNFINIMSCFNGEQVILNPTFFYSKVNHSSILGTFVSAVYHEINDWGCDHLVSVITSSDRTACSQQLYRNGRRKCSTQM